MPDKKLVLIVEDDRFLSSLIKARLTKDGYEVLQAFDGEQAMNILLKEQKEPDLIILDLIMPKVPGFEVMEKISLDPRLNKTPVIILTNLAQESDVEKAKQFGAADYFVKIRVSIDDLVKRAEGLLGG